MKIRVAIVAVVLACVVAAVWLFAGPQLGSVVNRAQVVGGLAGVAGLVTAVGALWPRTGRQECSRVVSAAQADAAEEYLAAETLRYWRVQAKARRITTPSPAVVRWQWAGPDVAVPVEGLQPARSAAGGPVWLSPRPGQVLTAGVVTELREQLYDRLDSGRIVVLGDPGAGKTGALLLLLIDILEHRDTAPGVGCPVPVWLTLGGWDPHTVSLQEWVGSTLVRDYPELAAPGRGGVGVAVELVRSGRVALFCDGLDEIAPEVQGAALEALDRQAEGLRVVLTSRSREYQEALGAGRLYGAAVVEVLPVEVAEAEAFLLAEQVGERHAAWKRVTRYVRAHPGSVAAATLTTPLALSLARDAYATSGDPSDLLDEQTYPTPEDLQRRLLTRFLTIAYPQPNERARALQVLTWIARHLGMTLSGK